MFLYARDYRRAVNMHITISTDFAIMGKLSKLVPSINILKLRYVIITIIIIETRVYYLCINITINYKLCAMVLTDYRSGNRKISRNCISE